MPKLTLRDLFFIVTVAAVLVAWWVDRSRLTIENFNLSRENAKNRDELEAMKALSTIPIKKGRYPNPPNW